tara:strand:- start:686 stop:1777 length:1092 start_codon:yes stop_codon:yes gene_type:complete
MDESTRPKVNDNSEINDIRTPAQFKGISFSKYKKTEVRKQLIENLKKGRIEPACYWCAELICGGHFMEVWETIIHYVGKHIHLGNPKILCYIEKRYDIFRNIMAQGQHLNELQLRNHPTIRALFAEIIGILANSNKRNSFEAIKIDREEEYDITQMSEKLIAPNISYIEPIFKKDDPKELFIAANEFAYNISPDKLNMVNACYWIEWIIEFQQICKKRKKPCYSESRNYPVEKKCKKDLIWILWEAMFHYAEQKGTYCFQLMGSIFSIFCIKYTTASSKKRRYLLYFAVSLLTETIPTNIDLINNKSTIETIKGKINIIYKQIKKNEESPNTDYLFANLERENTLEQSMRKMEIVNGMDFLSK